MSEYTVQAGDTLSRIAARFGSSVARLVSDNGIDDPNVIHVGDVLTINTARAPSITVDAAGNVQQVAADNSNVYTMPDVMSYGTPAGFDWREWLKPPRVYYVAAAAVVVYYLMNRKK